MRVKLNDKGVLEESADGVEVHPEFLASDYFKKQRQRLVEALTAQQLAAHQLTRVLNGHDEVYLKIRPTGAVSVFFEIPETATAVGSDVVGVDLRFSGACYYLRCRYDKAAAIIERLTDPLKGINPILSNNGSAAVREKQC